MFDTVRCSYPLPHHQDAEFGVRFTNGRVQEVEEKEPATAVSG